MRESSTFAKFPAIHLYFATHTSYTAPGDAKEYLSKRHWVDRGLELSLKNLVSPKFYPSLNGYGAFCCIENYHTLNFFIHPQHQFQHNHSRDQGSRKMLQSWKFIIPHDIPTVRLNIFTPSFLSIQPRRYSHSSITIKTPIYPSLYPTPLNPFLSPKNQD